MWRLTDLVLEAPGVRSVVLRNAMIYGNALGPPAQSVQIPALVRQAKTSGVARYIGRGLNRWSNVHITDVAALYALAVRKAPARTFIYAKSGEEALGEIVRTIAARLDLGAAQSWSAEHAIAAWGRNMAVFSLGSNSRVRGKTAAALGWSPTPRSVTSWIATSSNYPLERSGLFFGEGHRGSPTNACRNSVRRLSAAGGSGLFGPRRARPHSARSSRPRIGARQVSRMTAIGAPPAPFGAAGMKQQKPGRGCAAGTIGCVQGYLTS